MIINIEAYDKDTINCDLCIIGSGAAGTTLALNISSKKKILLVESGGFETNQINQRFFESDYLLNNKLIQENYQDTAANRLMTIGGTTQHWSGGCNPFTKDHFQKREWVPYSEWPINYSDLKDYYIRAQKILELSPEDNLMYGKELWNEIDRGDFPLTEGIFDFSFEKRSGYLIEEGYINWPGPIRFQDIIKSKIQNNKDNIDLVYNAHVTEMSLNSNKTSIENITLRSLNKKKIKVKANTFFLGAGGLGNAKILMNFEKNNYNKDYQNKSLTGKFFLNHPIGQIGELHTYDSASALKIHESFKIAKYSKNRIRPVSYLSNQKQKDFEILNHCMFMDGTYDRTSGVYTLNEIKKSMSQRDWSKITFSNLIRILKDIDDVSLQTYRFIKDQGVVTPVTNKIAIKMLSEQCPNPLSKILLSEKKDLFENNSLIVNWSLNEIDKRTVEVVCDHLVAEFQKKKIGRFKINEWILDKKELLGEREGTAHYGGVTRMSEDKSSGVVDKNLKYHNLENLFISGSSVFPTESFVNPTLTITALSLRLADYLNSNS